MLLDFRKPKLAFLDKFVSYSGKYFCFYGLHYVKGKTCYDVGASDKTTGQIVRRHYNEDNNLSPKAAAHTYWLELKEKMLAKLQLPEEPGYLEGTFQWLDINIPNWRRRKPS